MIDFGTAAATSSLVRGWSWNEVDPAGATFVWAVGPLSEVGVYLAWTRDLEVRMRCRSYRYPGAPKQRLVVRWDGVETTAVEIGPTFGEHGFTVPAELATPGDHRLSFEPVYFGRPAGSLGRNGSPAPRHHRKLSFGCDWIEIGRGPAPGVARGEGDTLWIPGATEVSFFLEPEREVELWWESLSPRGGSRLEVVWEVEGAEPVVATVTRDSKPVLDLSLPARTGTMSEIGASRTRGDPWGGEHDVPGILPARLTLRAAAGEPGAAEEPGVAVRSARVMAKAPPLSGTEAASGSSPPVEPERRRPESMLLWIVDTLRVDRLGFYGHDQPVSPNFDTLATRSTVFERAIAQSSWTRPAVATLLTGVGPERHGIRELSHGLEESFATLPERLRELGYATAGFSANANVTRDTGFEQGFDRFEYAPVDADELARRALAWLDDVTARSPEQPFFLMILSIEPHAGFQPAEPFRGRFAPDVDDPWFGTVEHMRALSSKKAPATDEVVEKLFRLYDAEIAWNDHMFGEFRRELKQRGMDPLVVVLADHGEAFKERGVFGHAWDLHREVLDIPFLIHRPGQLEGRRVRVPVQQVDLLPTLLEIARGGPVLDLEGDSLVPLLVPEFPVGDANTMRPFSQRLLVSTTDRFRRPFASLIRGRYKLIEPLRGGDMPDRQLFDWLADPEEAHDLAPERPLLAGVLARLLREQLDLAALDSVEAVEVELDEETRRRLEALGYIE